MTKNIFLVLFMLLFLSCTRETANQDKSETKIDSDRESLKGTVLQLPVLSENPIAIYHSPFGLIIVPAFKHKEIETTRLMIFDFAGNLVKELTLDHNVDYITVLPDDRVLYGITERPDRFIVKYHLK